MKLSRPLLRKYHLKRYKHSLKISPINIKKVLLEKKLDEDLPTFLIEVPKVLCFLKEPRNTSIFLSDLIKKLNDESPRRILVDHHETQYIGLAASWIFDEAISNLKTKIKSENKRFYLRGRTSQNRDVNNFLLANGFLRKMNIDIRWLLNVIDLDYSSKFQTYTRKGNKTLPQMKGYASAELTSYFDRCLKNSGLAVSQLGRMKLTDAFGEIIGNVEEHVDAPNDWFTLGCFEKNNHYANFAIINHGPSIFETLANAKSEAKQDVEDIEKTILDHRSVLEKAKDFVFPDNWDHTIWNVMALQEGISSKRDESSPEAGTRGQGLMDFLEFISEVTEKSEDSGIVIISGFSHIHIDFKKYKITRVPINNEEWRRLCFNAEGKMDLPQDKDYVFPLPKPFEGTIITGRFKISEEYASKIHQFRR